MRNLPSRPAFAARSNGVRHGDRVLGQFHGLLCFIVGILHLAAVGLGVMHFNGGLGGVSDTPMDRAADAVVDDADKVINAAQRSVGG